LIAFGAEVSQERRQKEEEERLAAEADFEKKTVLHVLT